MWCLPVVRSEVLGLWCLLLYYISVSQAGRDVVVVVSVVMIVVDVLLSTYFPLSLSRCILPSSYCVCRALADTRVRSTKDWLQYAVHMKRRPRPVAVLACSILL